MKPYLKWLPLLASLHSIPTHACGTLCKELVFDTLTTIDYGQTHHIFNSHGRWVEYNPMIHKGKEAKYFAAAMLLHAGVTYSLPERYRAKWQNSTIIIEGFIVGRNAYLGIGMSF